MQRQTHSETSLRNFDRQQRTQQYSYDITARLTYFAVSAELVFCGYVLLNATQFSPIKHSSTLFLVSGLAAFFGIFWRFVYNETYHCKTHPNSSKVLYSKIFSSKILAVFQHILHWLYVLLTVGFFVMLLWIGYVHLSDFETKENEAIPTVKTVSKCTKQTV